MPRNTGLVENQHLNGREGVVDQADPYNPGRWVVQLRTSTGLRDGNQLSIDASHLHVNSAPGTQAAQVADGGILAMLQFDLCSRGGSEHASMRGSEHATGPYCKHAQAASST
jgi:hypothetical protein